MTISAPSALTYTPPNRSTQAPSVFSSNADDCVNQLKTFSTELVTSVSELNNELATVPDITAASNAAIASANFQGNWSDLTGAFTVGYSVKHNGLLWIANTAIADVTASEPGVSGDWDQIGGYVREARTANIKLVAIDFGKLIDYTSGTFTQTFDPAANLGEGWMATAANTGTGAITLDPDSSETINGASTVTMQPGDVGVITCDGSAFFYIAINQKTGEHVVEVNTANGYGSTNTKIRRYTTAKQEVGTAITYADSAADGATFTINEDGLYWIGVLETNNSGYPVFGISSNSNQLTTNIQSITESHLLAHRLGGNSSGADITSMLSTVCYLSSGDVVRSHQDGSLDGANDQNSWFKITKIGV